MQLWQFFEALCQYPKEKINHKLLTSKIEGFTSGQQKGTIVLLEHHQQFQLSNVDIKVSKGMKEEDYIALDLFNSATMEYFGDHDLNSMINYISQKLHCAILLMNHDHSLLTATKENILRADFPDTNFEQLLDTVSTIKNQPHHFKLTKIDDLSVNIHWIENKYYHIGQLIFINQEPTQQRLINLVASYYRRLNTRQVIVKQFASTANRINYSKNLELALSQRSINSPMVQPDLTNYLSKKGAKYIFSIRAHRHVNEIFTRNLINQLNRIFDSAIYCYLNDSIVLLATIESPLRQHQHLLSQLGRLISNNRLQVGVSDSFDSVVQLFNAYHQSDLAMTASAGKLIQYSEVSPRYLANYLRTQHQLSLINPAASYLKDYDQQNHTEYYQTLVTYLLANFNVQRTAQRLSVHHNTILYRLKIIKRLLHYQFDDPQVNASVYLSLILNQYLDPADHN